MPLLGKLTSEASSDTVTSKYSVLLFYVANLKKNQHEYMSQLLATISGASTVNYQLQLYRFDAVNLFSFPST